jgi:hypothetical protein
MEYEVGKEGEQRKRCKRFSPIGNRAIYDGQKLI